MKTIKINQKKLTSLKNYESKNTLHLTTCKWIGGFIAGILVSITYMYLSTTLDYSLCVVLNDTHEAMLKCITNN